MTLFLILAPFGTFSVLLLFAGAPVSLFAGAIVAAALVLRDLYLRRGVKLLSAGTVVIFLVIGLYVARIDGDLNHLSVRLAVDGGVLLIALASMAFRTPFTIQYAREIVDEETRARPLFVRTNYILTGAWSAAFVLMMVADIAAIYFPSLPVWTAFALTFALRNGAAYFTTWYPQRVRAAADRAYGPIPSAPLASHTSTT